MLDQHQGYPAECSRSGDENLCSCLMCFVFLQAGYRKPLPLYQKFGLWEGAGSEAEKAKLADELVLEKECRGALEQEVDSAKSDHKNLLGKLEEAAVNLEVERRLRPQFEDVVKDRDLLKQKLEG